MAQNITREMFEKYKNTTSGGLGRWTIFRAINVGVLFPKAIMGITAGDIESYDTFIELLKVRMKFKIFNSSCIFHLYIQ